MSAAVNVFVTLAIGNGVWGVTFAWVAATASPATPVHVRPSARITVASMPGMTIAFRAASRAFWSAAAVAGSTGGAGGGATATAFDGAIDGIPSPAEPAGDAGTAAVAGVGVAPSPAAPAAAGPAPVAGLGELRAVPVAPRVAVERALAQGRQLLDQLAPARGGESAGHPGMVERARVVVEPHLSLIH